MDARLLVDDDDQHLRIGGVEIKERCKDEGVSVALVECAPQMQHDPHRPEDVLKVDCDDDGVGGDDPYDCLRYGLMARTAPGRAYVGAY